MKLAIDVREACRPNRAGKGQWTFGFVSELLSRGLDITLLTDSPLPDDLVASSEAFPSGWKWHLKALQYIKHNEIDLYISPTSYILPAFLRSVPTATVVHDMIAFRSEPHDRKASVIERLLLKRALKHSDHVFTVSKSTALDLHNRYQDLVNPKVIFAGPMHSEVPKNSSDGRTIACIGTICPRKNQFKLIQAYNALSSELRSKYILKLVGSKGWHCSDAIDLADKSDGVAWTGYASQIEYDSLLSTCAVLALPSMYEGFGMQILDGLQRGIPILTSDRGSLSEVVGDAAVLVEPVSVEDISAGLTKILSDDVLRSGLRMLGPEQAAKFSWKRTVDAFLDTIS